MRPVNLLPTEYRRDRLDAFKAPSTPALVFALAAVVLVAMLVGAFLVENAKVSDKQRTLSALQAELNATTPPQRQTGRQQQLLQEKDQRVVALNEALTGRLAWDRVLRNLSSVLPRDVWLSNLKASTPGSTTTSGATPSSSSSSASGATDQENFLVSGFAYSQDGVARLLARLEVVPDLSNVQLQKSETTDIGGRSIISFAIQADVRESGGKP
jgi:Tfp pilus assembly protein PilN